MKKLIIPLLLLFTIASTKANTTTCDPEVRKQSVADDILFNDLMTTPGGPIFSDKAFYPNSSGRKVISISPTVVDPTEGKATEFWKIQEENGDIHQYKIEITKDATGASFSTQLVSPPIAPQEMKITS